MNLSDFAYKLLTGEWRRDRAAVQARLETDILLARHGERARYYAGANPGPNRPMPAQLSTPEDYKQSYDRIVLIRGARQMEEDFPFFDGVLADFETYVVGDLNYLPSTGEPEADKIIRDFLEWQFDRADISGRFDLPKIARLWERSALRDGECGGALIDVGDTIKINSVSGDRIGNPLVGANIGPNNYNGIIVDERTTAPCLYQIYRRLPKLNSYVFERDVVASQFIHYFNPFRLEQYHGVTAFKNCISTAFDIEQTDEFTRLNIKWRASQLPYVTNAQGRPRGTGYEAQPADWNGVAQPMSIHVGGATQEYLKLGEAIVEYPNDFPNGQYLPLSNALHRKVAIGAKLPLEFCYASEAGGVVQRFWVDKAQGTFDEEKRWIRRTLLEPFKNRLIQKGIDTGFLDLSRFGKLSRSLDRFRGQWQMGRAISVDYGREVDADIKQIEAGLMSQQDYIASQNRDPQVVRRQIRQYTEELIEDAKAIAAKTGQPIEIVLPYLSKRFPNQQPAEPQTKAEETPVPVAARKRRDPALARAVDE